MNEIIYRSRMQVMLLSMTLKSDVDCVVHVTFIMHVT